MLAKRTWHLYADNRLNFKSCLVHVQRELTKCTWYLGIHGQLPRLWRLSRTNNVNGMCELGASTVRVVLHKQRQCDKWTWYEYTDNRFIFKSCNVQSTRFHQANWLNTHGQSSQLLELPRTNNASWLGELVTFMRTITSTVSVVSHKQKNASSVGDLSKYTQIKPLILGVVSYKQRALTRRNIIKYKGNRPN